MRTITDYLEALDEVRASGLALKDCDVKIRDDEEIVRAAVIQNHGALQYASDRLRDNPDMVLTAINERKKELCLYPPVLKMAGPNARNNQDLVMKAVEACGDEFEYASERLQNNSIIAIMAISKELYSYHYVGDKLKKDPMFIGVLKEILLNKFLVDYGD